MSPGELDLRGLLVQRGALLEGHFRLSSGRHSDRFVQKFRILEDPALLEPIAAAIADRFRAAAPTVVVGAAVGGILIAYEVARALHAKAIFVEKEAGVPTLRRGFTLQPEDRALVVEDVLTTGLSVRETIGVVRSYGAQIVGLGIIIARGQADFGIPTYALLEMPLRSYDETECSQCRVGEPLSDPGSRRS
jgi:orotate phosphoribosyltransferase